MPPPTNESQGLKIAVIALSALTVVLLVTCYLFYSSASEAQARMEAAQQKATEATNLARTAQNNFADLRREAGYPKYEDPQALDAALKKDRERTEAAVVAINETVGEAVAAAQQQGLPEQKVADLRQNAQQIVRRLAEEPNRTLSSTIDTMADLLHNQAQLTTAFALDNAELRTTLEGVNAANQARLTAAEEAAQKAREDLATQHAEYEKFRQERLAMLDRLQTINAQQAQEITNLRTRLDRVQEDFSRQRNEFLAQIREFRERSEMEATVLEEKDGEITYVDFTRNEVRTNLTRRMGARPQMRFAVFDRNAPIPSDQVKGTIELLSVDERGSVARILTTTSTADPIRTGDQIYSPVFNPNAPLRVALIGPIDMNNDGTDDRDQLRRLIQMAGGEIEYDLPPPGEGRESGRLSPRIDMYISDERATVGSDESGDYMRRLSEMTREARENGIRPMTVNRLMTYLGYGRGMAMPGRVEAIDRGAAMEVQNPGGRQAPAGSR